MKKLIFTVALAALCAGCAHDNYDRGGMGAGSQSNTGYGSSASDRTMDPAMNNHTSPQHDRNIPWRIGPGEMGEAIPR